MKRFATPPGATRLVSGGDALGGPSGCGDSGLTTETAAPARP